MTNYVLTCSILLLLVEEILCHIYARTHANFTITQDEDAKGGADSLRGDWNSAFETIEVNEARPNTRISLGAHSFPASPL